VGGRLAHIDAINLAALARQQHRRRLTVAPDLGIGIIDDRADPRNENRLVLETEHTGSPMFPCGPAPSFDPGTRQWASDDALLAEGGDLFGRDAQPRAQDVLDMLTELR